MSHAAALFVMNETFDDTRRLPRPTLPPRRGPRLETAKAAPVQKTPAPLVSPAAGRRSEGAKPIRSDTLDALTNAWMRVRFVGVGFLVGAVAVIAVASVRMARRVDQLAARVDQVSAEQQTLRGLRWSAAPVRAPSPGEPRATAGQQNDEAKTASKDEGLVFPALDVAVEPAVPAPLASSQTAAP